MKLPKLPRRRSEDDHPVATRSIAEIEEALTYVDSGMPEQSQRSYATAQAKRIRETLLRIPPAREGWRLLDVGADGQWIGPYVELLGYRDITVIAYQEHLGVAPHVPSRGTTDLKLRVDFLDAEVDPFPYPDESFEVVVCCSLLEHLALDPMHMMSEMNRVLKPGGHLTISTPNIANLAAVLRLLVGRSPYFESLYFATDVHRHNREFTTAELVRLVRTSGFEIAKAETIMPALRGLRRLAATLLALPAAVLGLCPMGWRAQHSIVQATKAGDVRERWPAWLYTDPWPAESWYRRHGGALGVRRLEEWQAPP